MDFADVTRSHLCIAFTEPGGTLSGRGGRHTELGIALALNMRVIVVGPREHILHCLPEVEQYDSWEGAREALLGTTAATSWATTQQLERRDRAAS
jgi:hypothetical protein